MEARPEPLAVGQTLGKYEVLRLLAVGGMGELYLARARGIEGFAKVVVLKRMLPQFAGDRDAVELFLNEARLTATLHHPNVVQVYDVDKSAGSYFFAMEYVHGQDLRSVLVAAKQKGRGVSIANALAIVRAVAAGLHYAHESKDWDGKPLFAVHRDVSPSNIMISYEGGVKIVDFGIAKAAAKRGRTQPGALRGTASYMSPEQCRGEETDRRSDVFAVGVLLFELTTGTRLFRGTTDYAIAEQLLSEDAPAPSTRLPGYPPVLERIVTKALRRSPSERYATAQELELDIEEFARQEKVALSSVGLGKFMRDIFGAAAEAAPLADLGAMAPLREGAPSTDTIATTGTAPRARGGRKSALRTLAAPLLGALLVVVVAWVAMRGPKLPSASSPGVAASSPPAERPSAPLLQSEPVPTAVASVSAVPPATASSSLAPSAPSGSIRPKAASPPRKSNKAPAAEPRPRWDLDSPLPP